MKIFAGLLLAITILSANAYQLIFTSEEKETCDKEGSCFVMSKERLFLMLKQAHRVGQASCETLL